ncbi:Metal resistance protein [Drechslerella dactyloides]|uniref:Metal resistance protein n=1 Tax=Drechslerella dactyloides TaxID=74499 RepID=A0AAD6J7L7_DREDA|nr:Metal resistance protein [Drechslerella dactyloides]
MGKDGGFWCSNPDGWGPLGPFGSYLTTCFIESVIDGVNVGMIVLGLYELYSLSKMTALPVRRDWNYFLKLVLVGVLFLSTITQAALQIEYIEGWAVDISFYTSLFSLVSIAIAFAIHHFEHFKTTVSSGVLLFFWLFYIILYGVRLQNYIETSEFKIHLPVFIVFCISFGVTVAVFLLEWLGPKPRSAYDAIEDENCPISDSNIFSIITFGWMTSLMRKGYRTFLTADDLWDMRHEDSTHTNGYVLERTWERELVKDKPSLWWAMGRGYGGTFAFAGIFKVIHDILAFVQPQLLRFLIAFIQTYSTKDPARPTRGLLIAFAMFFASVFQTIVLHQYFQRTFEIGMRIRAGLSSQIYKKALRLSNEGRAARTTGEIVNLMAVDTARLEFLAQYGQNVWSSPFQIIICMISLYDLVGYSMFAGIAVMIIMVPVNWLIARLMKRFQVQQMKNKDGRTRLVAEIVNNMKSIKLYAWGVSFMGRLSDIRNKELKTLRKMGVTQAFANFTWSTTPFLVSCVTFTTFVLTQDKPLTTEIVFPALTLFNLLTFPLAMLPMVLSMIVEASVAVNRLASFLTAEEVQPDAVIREPAATHQGDVTVKVVNGRFTWNRDWTDEKDALKNIDFTAKKGELHCIVGRVGQGKSSLLQAILGDLWKKEGTVTVKGAVAYVAQHSWVVNGTIKENILFGHRLDDMFYEQVIKACALTDDLAVLPDGDQTEVGEKGISLSGGQKARLTLARAVYARADVYLLDDCLSAVDQHVGRHLINEVLGPTGLLCTKTRIMATNQIPILMVADYITMLKDGTVDEHGTYQSVMTAKRDIYNLLKTIRENGDENSNSDEAVTPLNTDTSANASDDDEQMDQLGGLLSNGMQKKKTRTFSSGTLRRASVASTKKRTRGGADEEDGKITKQTKEHQEQGSVSWNVYKEYAKASNLFAFALYVIALVGAQTGQVGSSVWLKKWSEYNDKHPENKNIGSWIGMYFAIGIGASALVVIQTLILWIFCSIEAARKLHERMMKAIFRSPMSFFETTPTGRILNRFSGDVYKVDELLARTFNQLFANAARCAFTFIVISWGTPAFIALIVPLLLLYFYIQRYYLSTSRELKRLDSVSRSPIFAHFQESLGGLATIRAYQQQDRFWHENEMLVDGNLRAYFPSISANRWLAVRLEFIGSVIILGAAVFAVIAVAGGSGLSAGMVGLSMSYALQITQSLNWVVRQTVEVETNIVSVERILEYAALQPEAPEVVKNNRPSVAWPTNGAVNFKNYSTRYREGLELVLRDINLSIKPKEKIGVVGRTGAGKSSLTLALFRIIEAVKGNIEIDAVNTSVIGLLDLRKRLAIIPQDAALFDMTVRENLDPAGVRDDTELWSVLELSHLKDHVSKMEGKLDARIHEGGSNLSAGQRQLMCLARALLTPSNILVLDEDTIMDSDRIIVLDAGRVVEFDTPATLIGKGAGGQFYGLVKEAGLLEDAAKADSSSVTTAATSSATATATPAPPSGGADANTNTSSAAKDGEEGRR